MNDFSELEAELKKLKPAPVSDELVARIARHLAQADPAPTAGILPPPHRRVNFWSLGLGLAGAAALVLLGFGHFNEPAATGPALAQEQSASTQPEDENSGLLPSSLTRVVYHRHDEGLVFSPNHAEQPLRRVRYETRETMQWRDPQTGASLRVSYPAEQVVLTPVSFQ